MGLLQELGYSSVREYTGGLAEWRDRGLPLQSSRVSPPPPEHARGWIARGIDALERASAAQLAGLGAGLVVLCAALYLGSAMVFDRSLTADGAPVDDPWTALYFSLVCATTVGFGDVVPHGAARFVAVFEALAGLLLFGALISKFLSRRQERLVHEIHRLAYEDRLGRVQTNLHLVIRELASLEDACRADGTETARLAARLESAALVFATEVRSVHDVLVRPPEEPSEEVLESVLVALAGALETLAGVLACRTGAGLRTAGVEASLSRATNVALDICADCIPGALSLRLGPWLDRVQSAARGLPRR